MSSPTPDDLPDLLARIHAYLYRVISQIPDKEAEELLVEINRALEELDS